jgi:hypothetical protein
MQRSKTFEHDEGISTIVALRCTILCISMECGRWIAGMSRWNIDIFRSRDTARMKVENVSFLCKFRQSRIGPRWCRRSCGWWAFVLLTQILQRKWMNEIDRTQGRSEIKNIVTSREEVHSIDDTSKNVKSRTQTYDIILWTLTAAMTMKLEHYFTTWYCSKFL